MSIVEINWKPSQRVLRQFGFIALAAFGFLAVAAWKQMFLFHGGLGAAREGVAAACAAIALFSAAASLIAPKANLPLFLGLTLVSYPIGVVMSYVIMAVLFYFVFAPIALVMRAANRDPLQRRADPSAKSYWIAVEPTADKNRYFRQF